MEARYAGETQEGAMFAHFRQDYAGSNKGREIAKKIQASQFIKMDDGASVNHDMGHDVPIPLPQRWGRELDELARHHGLEPIKIIGDEYYAACGHDRPYIDHAPRTIAFAADAFDLVHESDLHAGTGL